MSLTAKILAPMLLLISLFAVSTLYSARHLNEALSQLSAIRSSLSSLPSSFREVLREGEVIAIWLRRRSKEREEASTRAIPLRLAALNARLSESLLRLEALQVPHSVREVQAHGRAIHASYLQLEAELSASIAQQRARLVSPVSPSELRWRTWLSEVDTLTLSLSRLSDEDEARQREIEEDAVFTALLFTSLSISLGLLFVFYISRLIGPLRELTQGVTSFEEGIYSHRLIPRGADELRQLAEALNRMGEAIEQRDIQLLQEQQKRLQEASLTAAGRLSAQITHELRNPLSSIGLNSELLAEELLDLGLDTAREEELSGLLGDITREIERLRGITEEYLRYARIPPPELRPVDLNILCREIIDFYRAEANRSAVQLSLDPDPLSRAALVDSNQVRAALLNLIRNAHEALENTGGYIRLKVRTGGGEAHISVQDDGIGISEELQDRIFEPFFSTKAQGTGLGLSMVQQLVKAQGGRFQLETAPARGGALRSRGLKGASFSIYLPLAR